jgi:hypothetical protein
MKPEAIPMFTFPTFRRQDDRTSARRARACRRPLVEDLEGRKLLSTFVQGSHIGTNVSAAIVGNHAGTNVSAAVVGDHIG